MRKCCREQINHERKEMLLLYDFVFTWILNDNSLFPQNILLKLGSQSIVRDDGRSLECSKYSARPIMLCQEITQSRSPITHNNISQPPDAIISCTVRVCTSGRHFFADILAFNEVLARWQCDGWEMYQHYLPSLSRLDRFNILKPGPISGWSPSYQTHNRWTERETAGWPGANPWNLNVKVWIFWSGLINERRWAIRPGLAGSASFITSRNIGY